MSSAVNSVVDVVTAPLKFLADPLGLASGEKIAPAVQESQAGLSESEKSNLASEEAKRKSKKKAAGTDTVLTSPLGATTSAATAVTKLGGM
tara:strand:+ start:685 stop:957 length:273 start_codon:yes stop_codon:yes gene_type:complete